MCWDAPTRRHHPVIRGLTHNRWRRRPPFGGVFVGVVLRRVWPVLLLGVVFAPHAAACVPGRLTSQFGVALGGRGHNLNCAAGGRRCAGRRRPGLVFGGSVAAASRGVVRWLSLPVGGGVACRPRGVAGVSPAGQTAMADAGPARRGPHRPRPVGIPLPAGSGGRPARTAGRKGMPATMA